MERLKFIADSSGDISPEDAQRLNIHLVPVGIVVDGKFYQDRVDFTPKEFYEVLKKAKDVPSTVAINPQTWYETLEPYVKSGEYDRLLVTTVGTPLSGNNDCVMQARQMLIDDYPEECAKCKIHVFDSFISTVGMGVGWTKAAEMYQKGAEYPEISAFLQDWFNSVEVYYVAFSLDLPKRSGRINAASAFFGGMLNIRPIMNVIDGKFTLNSKVKGDKKVPDRLLEIAKERMREGSDFFCMNGTHPTIVNAVREKFEAEFGRKMLSVSEAGPAMVVNAGWDMYCIAFVGENRNTVQNPRT